jgi:hypothetical protein
MAASAVPVFSVLNRSEIQPFEKPRHRGRRSPGKSYSVVASLVSSGGDRSCARTRPKGGRLLASRALRTLAQTMLLR